MRAWARSTSLVLRRHCRVSPQRRVIGFLCSFPGLGRCHARGRTKTWGPGVAAAHPALGASPAGGSQRIGRGVASKLATLAPEGGRIARRFSLALRPRPRPETDVFPPCGGGRSSERRRAATPFQRGRRPAELEGWSRVLRSRVAACAAARDPEPFGSRLRADCLTGHPAASGGQRVGQSATESSPRLPHAGFSAEAERPAQDTQREHDDTSHGVRFLSAR
jgi:hypothetical protein